ncbi:CASP-like protein 1 [Bidens hawaiensis]|uniref:CASP-like protein 1 n=1 Tax=Bidens hawaiensis TaxID=980011 RepID=UPI004049CA2D
MTSITPPHSTLSTASLESEYKGITGDVKNHVVVDVVLRVMLFVTSLIGIILMINSKQTKSIHVAPGMTIPMAAKFSQSPAFIYYVATLSVTCFYSIITGVLSVLIMLKPKRSSTRLLFCFLILDTLLFGIMASATGAAGGVAYIGFKGNSHTKWNMICNMYDSFCGHIAGSIAVSLLPSIGLLLLIWLYIFVLSKKIVR